ncbi:MAG: hypothetical protein ACRC33_04135, partial [Gemmataceae bacterium]
RDMLLTKLKAAAGAFLAVAVAGFGAGALSYGTAAAKQDEKGGAVAPKDLGKAAQDEVRKLQEKRRDLLREALKVHELEYVAGRGRLEHAAATAGRLLSAELDLTGNDAERVAAHERHFEKWREFAAEARLKYGAGKISRADLLDAEALALEARIGLLKAGGKPKRAEE